MGTIISCDWRGPKNTAFHVGYLFEVNGIKYKSSTPLKCKKLHTDVLRTKLLGVRFPVAYYPQDPSSVSLMLLERKNFTSYKTSVPDSLRHLVDYLSDC